MRPCRTRPAKQNVGPGAPGLATDMALYDMSAGTIVKIEPTTFAAAKVLERTHLQAALRDNIALVSDDLLVVAEEFGEFADANRRIDLLCVDRTARLVVVELKRTADGGHMELQALRYAAMVSTMIFDELVDKKLPIPVFFIIDKK